jgi:hypothetical protein
VAADPESETVRIVRDAECGIVLPPGRPELVAEAIRDAIAGLYPLAEMGARGREYVEREADQEIAFERYRRVVAESVASRSR